MDRAQKSCKSSSDQVISWKNQNVSQLEKEIRKHILSPEELRNYGYPVVNPDKTITVNMTRYPKNALVYQYIRKDTKNKKDNTKYSSLPGIREVECNRCLEKFFVTNQNEYIEFEPCRYHWGACKPRFKCKNGFTKFHIWTCCEVFGLMENIPCSESVTHVWSGLMPGVNDVTNKYKILASENCKCESCGIYSLDCEMSYTENGFDVVQVSLISINGECVYNTYVKPSAKIIDYNTRFSGVTKEIIDNVNTTLEEVHEQLKRFIHKETILIGHSLENDLRALHIVHDRCIDTSILYPSSKPFPFRNSLKHLTQDILGRSIQQNEHDSKEDAEAVCDLVKAYCSARVIPRVTHEYY